MAESALARRILIVDDDRDLVDSIAAVLKPPGYRTATAHDAGEARTQAAAFDPHVALIELRLSAGSGVDLIRELRAARPDLACVMMTAHAEIETAIDAMRQGACDCLRKPLDMAALPARLSRCFERLRLERERVAAEQALRAREQRCRALFEYHLDAIALIDINDGRVIDANPAAARLLGRTHEQLLQAREADLYPPEGCAECTRDASSNPSSETSAWILETAVPRPDGSERPVEITRTVVRHAGQAIAQAIIRDISERRRAGEAARQHQAELAHARRLSTLGEMASGLAHELNQPLAAVCTYVDACKHMVNSNRRQALTETLEKTAVQAQRAAQIVHRVRGFIRKQEPRKRVTAINGVIRDVVALIDPERREVGAKVVLDLADEPTEVLADTIQIQQVLLNLLGNGLDALRLSEVDRRALTIRTSTAREGVVEVAVSDSGLGPRDQTSDRIFEPFFTTKPEGMGLGLSISRSIVEAHGGRLWATPNPDCGMTFHLTLSRHGHGSTAQFGPRK